MGFSRGSTGVAQRGDIKESVQSLNHHSDDL